MQATQRLTYSAEILNDLTDWFDGAPIGLTLVDENGLVRRTNPAELELRGFPDHPEEFVGHHIGEFYADANEAEELLEKLAGGATLSEYSTTLARRDGTQQRVLQYLSPRLENGIFKGFRSFTFPHPEELRPQIAQLGTEKNFSLQARGIELSEVEKHGLFRELEDFFLNGPVGLHIVGGDGLVKHTNFKELSSMGYEAAPEEYIGQHIARFHHDQKVIDSMLSDLLEGIPLVNYEAKILHRDGNPLPVMIYSNSRMEDGNFINTRCFTVPLPAARKPTRKKLNFVWPRNEDFGLSNDPGAPKKKPNPMTMALRYIASRKRPEESLGFLAEVSRTLGGKAPSLQQAIELSVPFFADYVAVDLASGQQVAVDSIPELAPKQQKIREVLKAGDNVNTRLADLGIHSMINETLEIQGEPVGILICLRDHTDPHRRAFGPADEALAAELGRRLAFALELEQLRKKVTDQGT